MNEKISITLVIAGREYKFSVPRESEIYYREATKRINAYCEKFCKAYPNKDGQDIMAMVSLQFAAMVAETDLKSKTDDVLTRIERMCEDLDEFIKINQ